MVAQQRLEPSRTAAAAQLSKKGRFQQRRVVKGQQSSPLTIEQSYPGSVLIKQACTLITKVLENDRGVRALLTAEALEVLKSQTTIDTAKQVFKHPPLAWTRPLSNLRAYGEVRKKDACRGIWIADWLIQRVLSVETGCTAGTCATHTECRNNIVLLLAATILHEFGHWHFQCKVLKETGIQRVSHGALLAKTGKWAR